MSSSPLPTTRSFITSLFANLSKLPAPPDSTQISNPLLSADSQTKSLFLTLHCLFPNEFLPALDLLDRSLVTRFHISPPNYPAEAPTDTTSPQADGAGEEDRGAAQNVVYYVRSSQPSFRAARHQISASAAGLSYEVRLGGWNCSCPAFTFSAINALHDDRAATEGVQRGPLSGQGNGGELWSFGGLSLGGGAMPVCKHLLACALVEKCQALKGHVEERVVSREEAAAWAAAWGG